ncbi:hypothetical protein KC678_02780 [Candidatus Dojkabacteria bacterium]|uniref:Uncharacterized protein n=1 Tax=Candidatus Dojkabacteria bacterium TaxID=2099670 RepID=A0A955I946_9BACT|nr:hypothetical protein [Candidatus Dojkabacteria bacterium]
MPVKVTKAEPIDFNKITDNLKILQRNIAESTLQRALERYVAPFNSDIQFGLVIEEDSDSFTYYVVPLDNAASRNVAGDIVTSANIVNWLNNGTSIRFAIFTDYSQGTRPNSLSTSTPVGADTGYIDIENSENGIVARKFLEQITDENRSLILRRFKSGVSNL